MSGHKVAIPTQQWPAVFSILVLLLLFTLIFPVTICHDIFVDSESKNGVSNTSCWTGGRGKPCLTLSLGLNGLQQNNQTTLWISNGTYNLDNTSNDTFGVLNYQFVGMSDIAIIGVQGNESQSNVPVTVTCLEGSGAGLTFVYTNNITIRGVEMISCGAFHKSTSQNFTLLPEYKHFTFAKFYTTLYFMLCRDVHMEHVNITNSSGTGAVFYSTVGTNTIHNASFTHNRPLNGYPGGGGLYIEFSYCTPSLNDVDDNCSEGSNVPGNYSRDSDYFIESSVFYHNKATLVDPEAHTFILPQLSSHLAFGRGGGISVFFKGNAVNNRVTVSGSNLTHNKALWGAGLFVEYQDMSQNNTFIIENSTLDNNRCINSSSEQSGTGGGGARVGYIFFGKTHSKYNSIVFNNVNFTANKAYFGGGLSFYVARENTPSPTNHLEFNNCLWSKNTARVGAGADLSIWHPVPAGAVVKPTFRKCTFESNSASYTQALGQFVGIGTLYVDSIPVSFKDYIMFKSNTETAMAAVSTGIYVTDNTTAYFYNNTGRNGGAVALMGYAFIEVSKGTDLHFVNNSAEVKGGAIYGQSIGEHDLISSRNCFIRYNNISSTPRDWNVTFNFTNNRANSETNSIYVTSLLTCLWGGAFGSTELNAAAVFCWNTNGEPKKWIYNDGDCSTDIATSPASFNANTNTSNNDTNFSLMYSMNVFPGKRRLLPIVTKDDRNKTVTNYTVLIAQVIPNYTETIALDSSSIYISDNSVEVHGDPNTWGVVKLETIDPRVISTQVNITVDYCPPGMIPEQNGTNTRCECNGSYSGLVQCYGTEFRSKLQRGAWIGLPNNNHSSPLLAGQCPYCAEISSRQYFYIPQHTSQLERSLCGRLNRKGVLCGQCKDGFGPVVNSKNFDCVNCTEDDVKKNWFFYTLTEFLPITLFFFVVVFFNVSVTSGPANAFVFFAQIMTTAITLDGDGTVRMDDAVRNASIAENVLHIVPYGIWNLNFFRPYLPKFCLSPNITTLQLLSTGYITAFYPLVLVAIFYSFSWLYGKGYRPIVCLCRPLHFCFARLRRIWDFQRSIIHALATFILLSYTKFTLVSFILLTATPLLDNNGDSVDSRLYYDGSIVFGSIQHAPYLIVSVVVLFTFVALPPLILIVPSVVHFVQKFLISRVPDCCGRCQPGATFDQFLNAFHGCYKDGTGGPGNEYDFRWFAGFYFLLRVVLLAIFAFTPDWFFQCALQQIVCTGAFLAFVILRPYKNDLYNKVDAAIFAIIIALCSITMYNYYLTIINRTPAVWTFVLQYILLLCPLVYISVVVVHHLWTRNKTSLKKLFKKLRRNIDEELVQDEDAFLHDAEQAGRFGRQAPSEDDSQWSRARSVVRNNESQPLLQNQSPQPPPDEGSSNNSQRESNQSSDRGYGAMSTAGTQTPSSDNSTFGSTGVDRFQVGVDEPKDDVDTRENRRKKLFFTH